MTPAAPAAPTARRTPQRRGRAARAVLAGAVSLLALGACDAGDRPAAEQLAARVNGAPIALRQVDELLQAEQPGAASGSTAARDALERLIDRTLAVQQAEALELEQEPAVQRALASARADVLARAYLERMAATAQRPSAADIERYYRERPELFAERRIYRFEELAIEAGPREVESLEARLAAAADFEQFVDGLRAERVRFERSATVRAAEQLPLARLGEIARLAKGESVVSRTPSGVQVLLLADARRQPLSAGQAGPAIEQYLLNARKQRLAQERLQALRAEARIEYDIGHGLKGHP